MMDGRTEEILNELTQSFYRSCAASFSATREHPWHGWQRVLELLPAPCPERLSLLDLACGNMRFERYLEQTRPASRIKAYLVDSCAPLLSSAHPLACTEARSFVRDLLGAPGPERIPAQIPACDLSVCFGFMHHVPGKRKRIELLTELLGRTTAQGLCALSFWQFEKDERLSRKADVATRACLAAYPELQLEQGDRLLGWKGEQGVYRYCHSFSDEELSSMALQVEGQAELIATYEADGKAGNLNRYLVFRKR